MPVYATVAFCPIQTGPVAENVEVATGITATVTVSMEIQFVLEPVTLYVVVVKGVAITVAELVSLKVGFEAQA